MLHVAGKPVLAHILDKLEHLEIEEVIFIIGHLGYQIERFIKENYSFKARFIEQKEMLGQAHAINLAKGAVKDDALIIFVDTIFEADLSRLKDTRSDGVIYVKEVEDPRRFGVVVTDKKGKVTELIEKPEKPVSNLVNIGLYYIKDMPLLFDCIDNLIADNRMTKGEFYLVDAFQMMIEKGTEFSAEEVKKWLDCGKVDTLLATNKYLLEHGADNEPKVKDSVIIPPVFIEDDVKIKHSIIGPYVSIASKSIIENSIIKDSIINENADIQDAQLARSVIGDKAVIKNRFESLNVGDSSEISID